MKNEKMINAWDKMKPSDEIKQQILNEISAGKHKNRKKFQKMKYILTAAFLLITISMLSAFGVIQQVGEIIETLIFNAFNVNKVDTLIAYDGEIIDSSYSFKITDPIVNPNVWVNEYVATFEEAEKHLDFNPKCLNHIPENYLFRDILVLDNNSCLIYYYNDIDGALFSLSQQYVGENAEIKVYTTAEIEKIIISGDIEALLQTDKHGRYMLMWIKDSIGYTLSASEKDELIKMAESVK